MTWAPLLGALAATSLAASPDATPLREADLALDRAVAAHDRAAFAALLTPDTYWFGGGVPLIGPGAVVADWNDFLTEGGPSLRWTPDRAEVAASLDLGFTVGTWRYKAKGPEGTPVERTGQYVTVWTRGADGRWRVLVDGALRPPSGAAAGELVRTPERRATSAAGDLRIEAGRYRRGDAEHGLYLNVVRAAAAKDEVLVETLAPAPPAK
jgi:ketosteroid isomerase-like protein